MSHTPPVPPGNQSPFPRAEPPHAHHAEGDGPRADVAPGDAPSATRSIGAAQVAGIIGIGVVGAIAGIFLLRSSARDAARPRRGTRRRAAKRG